jgi:hypothetical protein
MSNSTFNQLKETIIAFQQSLQAHLPALEIEINAIIDSKVQDQNTIEHSLDTLLSLVNMGVGKELFVKLLEYYKTIDTEGATFYWDQFDKEEE